MTCQQCQPLAIDLARGLPPFDVGGAVQRADVLSHVARCKRCAQWLREQEALSDALRAAAEADAALAAPPSVEANVMAIFRARQAQRPLPIARADAAADKERATPPHARKMWRPTWPAGRAAAFAAAAIILIAVLTMSTVSWLMPSSSSPNGATRNAASASPAPPPRTNAAIVEVLPDKGPKGTKGRPAPPRPLTPHATAVGGFDAPRATRPTNATRRSTATRASNVARRTNEFSGPAFVLLPYVEPLRPTEMRHIMRVRMPREQLTAGGIQTGGADDAVLADVLVGEDGTARAVRIVQ